MAFRTYCSERKTITHTTPFERLAYETVCRSYYYCAPRFPYEELLISACRVTKPEFERSNRIFIFISPFLVRSICSAGLYTASFFLSTPNTADRVFFYKRLSAGTLVFLKHNNSYRDGRLCSWLLFFYTAKTISFTVDVQYNVFIFFLSKNLGIWHRTHVRLFEIQHGISFRDLYRCAAFSYRRGRSCRSRSKNSPVDELHKPYTHWLREIIIVMNNLYGLPEKHKTKQNFIKKKLFREIIIASIVCLMTNRGGRKIEYTFSLETSYRRCIVHLKHFGFIDAQAIISSTLTERLYS